MTPVTVLHCLTLCVVMMCDPSYCSASFDPVDCGGLCADLVEQERRFLLNLERNIRRSSATSSDAEDISEELNVSQFYILWNQKRADTPSEYLVIGSTVLVAGSSLADLGLHSDIGVTRAVQKYVTVQVSKPFSQEANE